MLLEGLEVVFIVLTFGSAQGSIPLAAVGAAGALVLVAGVGIAVRAPLARVPENLMKFAVGVMLTTFGIFWSAEGAGRALARLRRRAPRRARLRHRSSSFLLVRLLRRERLTQLRPRACRRDVAGRFGRFWWDFVIGDDWLVAVLVAIAIGATAALAHADVAAWWLMPLAVPLILWLSLRRAIRSA